MSANLYRENLVSYLHLFQCRCGCRSDRFGEFLLRLQQLDVEAERLKLADQHVDAPTQHGRERRVALHDGFVNLRSSSHVVRLGSEKLLEDVRRAIGLERPHFHFSEPLSAELGLSAQRLLGDERIGPDRPRVNLVVHQVRELQHVDVADGDILLERHAGHTVEEVRLAALRQTGLVEPALDLGLRRAVEDGRGEVETKRVRSPAEVRFENLTDVHTRRNAERIQHDFHRRAVRQVRHVFLGKNARDDALVAVAAGHLVADRELALHRHVHLDELDDTRRQLVAAANLLLLLFEQLTDDFHLPLGSFFERAEIVFEPRIVRLNLQAHHRVVGQLGQNLRRQHRALLLDALAAILIEQVAAQRLAVQHLHDALLHFVVKDADFVLQVLLHHVELFGLDRLGSIVLLDTLARENLHADDDALDAGGADEGRIADVAGLLAEDRAEQLLFRRELRLAFRRDLAHQNISWFYIGTDSDNSAFIQIAQERFRHVRDVPRDFFGPEFRIARLDLELFDVNGGVVVVLHHPLRHENRVFEVVPAPRHEGDQHVAAERELAQLRAWTISHDLALVHLLPDTHDGLLADARVLVRALELREVVDVGAHLLAQRRMVFALLAFHADDDAERVDVVDGAGTTGHYNSAGIARGDVLHAGSDKRRPRPQKGNGLALHVRAHQRAVRVVVLEERDEGRGDRDELLRRHVDELHAVALGEDEVAGLPAVDALAHKPTVRIELGIRLRDDVLVFFPCGQIERVRLELRRPLLPPLRRSVLFEHFVLLDDLAGLELRAAAVGDEDVVGDPPFLDFPVRRLDEAELVDA